MKTTAIIIILSLIGYPALVSGQIEAEPIRIEKAFGGYNCYQNGQRLTIRQLSNAVATNQQAYREIESARKTYVWQLILAGLGGVMIGNPVGTSIGGGEPDWSYAVVGAGLAFISFVPLNRKVNREIKRGVDIYNAGLKASAFPAKNNVSFGFTGYGIGITVIIN